MCTAARAAAAHAERSAELLTVNTYRQSSLEVIRLLTPYLASGGESAVSGFYLVQSQQMLT